MTGPAPDGVVADLDVDVAVVGYGPVGALAALLLGRAGVSCAVLDQRAEIYPLPRAVAGDDEVLDILLAAGLDDAVAAMLPAVGARFADRQGATLLDVDLPRPPSGRPPLVFYRQPELEAAIRAAVTQRTSARLLLGAAGEVVGLRPDDEGVTLTLAGGSHVRARYVVACDGANSPVRGWLGVAFPTRGTRQRWLVVDLAGPPPRVPRDVRVTWHCDRERPAVSMPTPGGMRIEVLLPDPDGPLGPVDVDVAAAQVHHYLGGADLRVERARVYAFATRTAASWRVGRVLLAGDAAHTMAPFAGQGLAAGLRDVANLAGKLPAVLSGDAPAALLDRYEAERRPHLAQMLRLTWLIGWLLTPQRAWAARLRDAGLRAASRTPGLGGWLRSGGPRPRPRPTMAVTPAR